MDDGVTVVVRSTVDTIVKDPTKDVLLEVYAPWCGACKQFAPTYHALAAALAHVPSLVIAKMDGTANEHPAVDAQQFPTVVLFPAGEDAAPVEWNFEEGHDLPALVAFLQAHAKVAFAAPDLAPFLKELENEDEYADPDDEEGMTVQLDQEGVMAHDEL